MRRSIVRRLMITDAMVRYNDDIRSIFQKLKDKIKEAIARFKALHAGRKIAAIFGKILMLAGGIVGGTNAVSAVQTAKKIRELYNQGKDLAVVELEMPDKQGGFQDPIVVQGGSFLEMLKGDKAFLKNLIFTIGGLISAFCGYIIDTYAKS